MKHNMSNRRSRNRGNGSNGARRHNKMQVFDSNGPDVRIRGTAHQVCEKYMALAKDSASMGDKIMAENYLQHAEHYQRIINEWAEQDARYQQHHQERQQNFQTPQAGAEQAVRGVDDDLSLPSSILGAEVKPVSTLNVHTVEEPEFEDA